MRARLNADPDKVVKTLVRRTAEGVATLFARLTGRNVSPEEMAEFADELAALRTKPWSARRGLAPIALKSAPPSQLVQQSGHSLRHWRSRDALVSG